MPSSIITLLKSTDKACLVSAIISFFKNTYPFPPSQLSRPISPFSYRIRKDPRNRVVFGTMNPKGNIPGVHKVLYKPSREVHLHTHHYLRSHEKAVLEGQAVYRLAQELKSAGFYSDIVYGHSGWGATMFVKDVFSKAQLNCFFEWFYKAEGSDADFDPSDPIDADSKARIRIKNSPILTDLYSCDRGICPTEWQKQQFPQEFHAKLKALHHGINTDFFTPNPKLN